MSVSIYIKNTVQNMNEDECAILELNISNTNFRTLWSALGILVYDKDDGMCGEMHPLELHKKLQTLNPDCVLRAAMAKSNSDFDFGIDEQRVRYYTRKLKEIVAVALKREEYIVWA